MEPVNKTKILSITCYYLRVSSVKTYLYQNLKSITDQLNRLKSAHAQYVNAKFYRRNIIQKLVNHAITEITSKQGYTSLFKAFVVITTVYLVSTMQVTNIALPIEADAHKLKFSVEKELKKSLEFGNLECNFEMKTYADCKLAKYKYSFSNSSLDALDSFHSLLYILAYVTGILSLIGFIFHPYVVRESGDEGH